MQTNVGKTFYFSGDWQTEPGRWRIVGEPIPLTGQYPCEPADRANVAGVSYWWPSVVENCLKRESGCEEQY